MSSNCSFLFALFFVLFVHTILITKPEKNLVPSLLFHMHYQQQGHPKTIPPLPSISTTRVPRYYIASTLNINKKSVQRLYRLYPQYQQKGCPKTIPSLPSISTTRVSKEYTASTLNISKRGIQRLYLLHPQYQQQGNTYSAIPAYPNILYNTYTYTLCTTTILRMKKIHVKTKHVHNTHGTLQHVHNTTCTQQ